MAEPKASSLVVHLANAAPTVGFLAALLITHQFQTASWVMIVLSALALALGFALDRRLAPIPAFSGVMALVFGGLSIALKRNDLLQMKMSIVDGLLGAALFGGLAWGKNPLKLLLGSAVSLPDAAWRVLTIRYAAFFWASALANEVVRRTQTAEVWATFRVVAIVAAVLFGVAQFPLLRKHWQTPSPTEIPEPPEPGF
jgi:intracellular septation protein